MILEFQQKRLRDIPFNESYLLRDNALDLAHAYTAELIDVIGDWRKAKASSEQLNRTMIRALYALYLRGVLDEREHRPALEPPGADRQEADT